MEKINFIDPDTNEVVEFAVEEETQLNGIKYLLVSDGIEAAADGYFTSFITSDIAPIVFMLIFLALTAWIVFRGVEKGIEKFSKIIMPGLILLIVIIAIFCLTLTNTAPDGTVRTGMQGLAVYLKPDFHGLTVKRFLEILLDAMSQLFFSLSVSMGIMITYGSYVKNDIDLNKATNQIEIFDTGVAILAGKKTLHFTFQYFRICSILQSCFRSDSVLFV